MADEYSVSSMWINDGDSHLFTARGVTREGRIIGNVTVDVNVEPENKLESIIDELARLKIEETIKSALAEVVKLRYGKQIEV